MGHLALESLGQDPDADQEACGTFAFTAAPGAEVLALLSFSSRFMAPAIPARSPKSLRG